jgi:hypothetical protein
MNLPRERLLAAAERESVGSKTTYDVQSPTGAPPQPSHSMCFHSPFAGVGCAITSALKRRDQSNHLSQGRSAPSFFSKAADTARKETSVNNIDRLRRGLLRVAAATKRTKQTKKTIWAIRRRYARSAQQERLSFAPSGRVALTTAASTPYYRDRARAGPQFVRCRFCILATCYSLRGYPGRPRTLHPRGPLVKPHWP